MRYHLRTLLVVLMLAPPVLAGGWYVSRIILERLAREELLQLLSPPQIPVGAPAGVSGPHVIPYYVPAEADLDLPFKSQVQHPTYNDRKAARALDRVLDPGRYENLPP